MSKHTTITTKTLIGVAALIGAAVTIGAPGSAGAANSPATGVCLAIDDEPICDLARSPSADDGGGTRPTVIDTAGRAGSLSSVCVRVGRVHACVA
jgi:hypothetical protein